MKEGLSATIRCCGSHAAIHRRDPSARAINKLRHVIHLLRLKLGCDDHGRSFIIIGDRAGFGLRKGDNGGAARAGNGLRISL
jgi:hypothetical protein